MKQDVLSPPGVHRAPRRRPLCVGDRLVRQALLRARLLRRIHAIFLASVIGQAPGATARSDRPSGNNSDRLLLWNAILEV